ncbi:MAG: gamma-glutamylcyclotransferase family protein [Oceanicaulis sp.]
MGGDDVKAGDLIAVYGLLRAGETGFAQFGLAHAFRDAGPCVLTGELWDLGRYPGLMEGEGRVLGELFEVIDPSVMTRLDAFEDYWPGDPARSRYARRKVQLIEPDHEAWVYVWILGLDAASRIESGDWLNR